MEQKSQSSKKILSRSKGAGILIIVIAAITLEATSVIQYIFAEKGIRQEASLRAGNQLEMTRMKIMDVVNQTETAVHNSVWISEWCLDVPDSMQVVARRIVTENPVIVGSTLALVPGYNKNYPLLAPYICKEDGRIELKSLATQEYNYPAQEWFSKPIDLGHDYWSEPYIDTGGGNILMTTYSVPIRKSGEDFSAVLTADISLEWLGEQVRKAQVYPHSFGIVLSKSGNIMVSPIDTLVMRDNVRAVNARMEKAEEFNALSEAMLGSESGSTIIHLGGKPCHVFYAPVERTGWSMAMVVPDEEIYGGIRKIGLIVTILQLLGLGMLIVILRTTAKNQLKYQEVSEKKERMESELHIARDIQMSMIPTIFPPFPDRKDLDMSACLVPAKEVGGDLFDFYIRDEHLFFCIGDVSGKGVPASLLMAVTRSLFRTLSAHEKSPQRIVSMMNDSMSDMDQSNMFVTLFYGILNLTTGHLRYCNAGHNPPLLLSDKIQTLDSLPNLPLGVMPGMSFQEQDIYMTYDDALFLYTDGLTEAENHENELFGEERMEKVLHTRRSAQKHLDAMQEAVSEFVGEAPQSDDLTMLFIHFLNDSLPGLEQHVLILHNDIKEIPLLASFMDKIADQYNLDHGLVAGINLALEEAIANVMMYAYPEGTIGTLELKTLYSGGRITFIITDSGKEFDPTAAPEADITLSVEERPIGGLGILMVRTIMDDVTYKRCEGKNILTLLKRI